MHLKQITTNKLGYWGLTTNYDPRMNQWDFTFDVKVGGPDGSAKYQFHPVAIRQRIVTQHGVDVYNQWKEMVMNDFDSLMALKESWKPPVPLVASCACSKSSDRLCRKMGFEVRGGVVFWLS